MRLLLYTQFTLSALRRRCELDNCSERVQTSNVPSATVLSSRESNSHCRDSFIWSGWRCELDISYRKPRQIEDVSGLRNA